MCLIARDEHANIVEWLHHYLALGVGRIYVYDHASRPPMITLFDDLEYFGLVEYHWISSAVIEKRTNFIAEPANHLGWVRGVNAQLFVYQECIDRYRHRHQWMAFFDSDELLLLRDPSVQDLPTFLRPYEPYGALVVQWMMYGSSGHLARPNGSTLDSYWKCYPHGTWKAIVNMDHILAVGFASHCFNHLHGAFAVNEAFERCEGTRSAKWLADKVVLNHYVTRSADEFAGKSRRGTGAGKHKGPPFLEMVDRDAKHDCRDSSRLMENRTWRLPVSPIVLKP